MLVRLALCIFLVGSVLGPTQTHAARSDSEHWFLTLSFEDRIALELGLIWSGDYVGLADGSFNGRLFRALVDVQSRYGTVPSGVLSTPERERLISEGNSRAAAVNYQVVRDPITGASIGLPLGLLQSTAQIPDGYQWTSSDNSIRVETTRLPQNVPFIRLYEYLSKPDADRTVSYSRNKETFFIVTGAHRKGGSYYTRVDRTSLGGTGFWVSWAPSRNEQISRILIAMASTFDATGRLATTSTAVGPPSPVGQPNPPDQHSQIIYTGSGFFVDTKGRVVTNEHVVHGCKIINIPRFGPAQLLRIDPENDLALLQLGDARNIPAAAPLRTQALGLAEPVAAIGYPYSQVLGSVNATIGTVSSLSGIGSDSRKFQFTAAVQPGNSGGPVIDTDGNIVGVVQARLDDLEILKTTNSLPQNVNFAIRSELLNAFLTIEGIRMDPPFASLDADKQVTVAPSVVQRAASYTVQVICTP
jgi:serine protease Do